MHALLALALVSLLLMSSVCVPAPARAVAAATSPPSAENVYDQTDTLAQWYRYLDSPGHREAERHILSMFESYGLNATVQEYTAQRLDGSVRAANVLGLLEGEDPTRALVIGGHYDNNERSSKGAYDNAVGVGTVLELARAFSQGQDAPPLSMLFAAWDSEEGGGAGSAHYLEDPVWDHEVVGYINLDMFSLNWPVLNTIPGGTEEYFKLNVYTSPVHDFAIYGHVEYTEGALKNFSDFRDTVEDIAYGQMRCPTMWVIVQDDTVGISDHRFFVERSVPSVWLRGLNERPREESDINEICLKHTPLDTMRALERYAGGKQYLLSGIGTGLTLACELAVQWMFHVVTSAQAVVDDTPAEAPSEASCASSGLAVGAAVLLLVAVPAALVAWRRGRRRPSRAA